LAGFEHDFLTYENSRMELSREAALRMAAQQLGAMKILPLSGDAQGVTNERHGAQHCHP
jgi:hypothetical protein